MFKVFLAFCLIVCSVILFSIGMLFQDYCTEQFCDGDKVRIVDTQKRGIIMGWRGNEHNKVWQIYVDSEKLFYIIPENRLINEE